MRSRYTPPSPGLVAGCAGAAELEALRLLEANMRTVMSGILEAHRRGFSGIDSHDMQALLAKLLGDIDSARGAELVAPGDGGAEA